MNQKTIVLIRQFSFQWFISGLGIWVASSLLGDAIDYQSQFRVIVLSGLVLALVNIFLKPIVIFLSLPAILFSLGLFMIVINGLMLLVASQLYEPLHVTNLGAAMLAGMVIGLVNYLVVTVFAEKKPN